MEGGREGETRGKTRKVCFRGEEDRDRRRENEIEGKEAERGGRAGMGNETAGGGGAREGEKD